MIPIIKSQDGGTDRVKTTHITTYDPWVPDIEIGGMAFEPHVNDAGAAEIDLLQQDKVIVPPPAFPPGVTPNPTEFPEVPHGTQTVKTVKWSWTGNIPERAGQVGPFAVILKFQGLGVTWQEQMVIGWKISDIVWDEVPTVITSSKPQVRISEQRTGTNAGMDPN